MAVQDLIKKWDDALMSALCAAQQHGPRQELSNEDLEAVSGPAAMALSVRTGVVAGGGYTKKPTCGCTWAC